MFKEDKLNLHDVNPLMFAVEGGTETLLKLGCVSVKVTVGAYVIGDREIRFIRDWQRYSGVSVVILALKMESLRSECDPLRGHLKVITMEGETSDGATLCAFVMSCGQVAFNASTRSN